MNVSAVQELESLRRGFAGEILLDSAHRMIYSTDASVYQSLPLAVAIAKTESDILELIRLANAHRIGLIPRTAGTSLAGQVVGDGIVVDVSRHFTQIIEINKAESWVKVQPGVIRDELNAVLAEQELYFAPETSTSNRAMIGGMLGNNSCGANSIVYGNTRDHVIEVTGFLSDGTKATFGPLTRPAWQDKTSGGDGLESRICDQLHRILSPVENRQEIRHRFPATSIRRRNTGYAIDLLLDSQPFGGDQELNLAKLIAGSEGTLFFATEIKLNCIPPPPENSCLVCVHFSALKDALQATRWSMAHQPHRCELIDELVVDGARRNLKQARNIQFVRGEPAAVLLIEFRDQFLASAIDRAEQLVADLQKRELGYHHPILDQESAEQAWEVRRAGLGVAYNRPGDVKPVTVIEDTAVDLERLPDFIEEIDQQLDAQYGLRCVHYGHAGAGELHLRPNLNLKSQTDRHKFRQVAQDVARIVRKYGGSLSGEHGDGRLRSEFLRFMIGDRCYQWIEQIKNSWDPNHIFNPGKIVDAPGMDQSLRLSTAIGRQPDTVFRFGSTGGLLGAVEMCSGLGDCRKSHLTGGTMCPSYMATRDEKDTTRARANLLRHILSQRSLDDSPLGSPEVRDVLDLCLSCKGCKSECPSNVDMARIKAEFMQGFYDVHGTPWKIRMLAGLSGMLRCGSWAPGIVNFINTQRHASKWVKRLLGIHPRRSMPQLQSATLRSWFRKRPQIRSDGTKGALFFFCDEFTNYIDVSAGIAAIELLEGLGYRVTLPDHVESGRACISGGLLRSARKIAEQNVRRLGDQLTGDHILVGIEPSAVLTLRDEYPDLVDRELQPAAVKLAENTLLIEEFLDREIERGRIVPQFFDSRTRRILLHGHCHQKALSSLDCTVRMLSLPENHEVSIIPSGCCGMAGFFGFEEEHFELSLRIGELVLFPAIRSASAETGIAATGTSCRHQILDGTGRLARHPVEILRESLLPRRLG